MPEGAGSGGRALVFVLHSLPLWFVQAPYASFSHRCDRLPHRTTEGKLGLIRSLLSERF